MRIINKIGNEQLLEREKTLFLCSKHTSYIIYSIIFDWVENLYETDCVMCFKTTEMEFEVMTSLLVHKVPTILVVMKRFTDGLVLGLVLVSGLVIELVTEFGRINVIHTNPPSVPYSGSGSPTVLHASTIPLTPFRSCQVLSFC